MTSPSDSARLQVLVETAVDGIIVIDSDGIVVTFNPACERLFGYAASEVLGCNVKMLMPQPYHDDHDRYLRRYLDTGERKIIGIGREVAGRRKDGSTFPIDLSVGEARQGSERVFVGIIHDLTERKRTEEQLIQAQKMEAVGHLSGGIAHDFNNLLTVIIGNAEALAVPLKARPDLMKLATDIVAAGERGAELTQRLLAFGRRQILKPIEVDCIGLIRGMVALLRRTLREDIAIDCALSDDTLLAYADPVQLESAILNLVINAQDAMPDGGTLTIATANAALDENYRDLHPEVRPGSYVMINVTDDGTGMSPEVKERAFEPFFTTKDVGKGSGLGLSMVYGFVKQSNGHVAIYSEPGLGTTIRIYLPAVSGSDAPERRPIEVSVEALQGGHETVLVCEDDPFVRNYALACLESLGYGVVPASDGREALSLLDGEAMAAHVLFTDIVLPGGMNGWELAERARQLRPRLRVLYTSGYALDAANNRRRELLMGNRFLSKPYRKSELARALRQVIADAEQS